MRAIVFAALLVCVSASPHRMKWSNCGQDRSLGSATNVSINPCSTYVCEFSPGQTISVNITFTPRVFVRGVTVRVEGQVETFSRQILPIPNSDACTDSGLTCPLKADKSITYHAEFTIPSFLTKLTAEIFWYLVSTTDSTTVVCIETEAKVW